MAADLRPAAAGRGFYIWGSLGGGPALYRSDDGRSWSPTDLRAPNGRQQDTRICDLTDAPGGGVAAIGEVLQGRRGVEYIARWSSRNGAAWDPPSRTEADLRTCLERSEERASTVVEDVGTVRIEPNGEPGPLYFRPASPG